MSAVPPVAGHCYNAPRSIGSARLEPRGSDLIDEAPATRASLLLRLRDPKDAEAWRQFVQVYASVVYGFARRRGLQDADAADLMQDVFRSVAAHAGRLNYDRGRGTFRGWLYTVTRNKLYNFL